MLRGVPPRGLCVIPGVPGVSGGPSLGTALALGSTAGIIPKLCIPHLCRPMGYPWAFGPHMGWGGPNPWAKPMGFAHGFCTCLPRTRCHQLVSYQLGFPWGFPWPWPAGWGHVDGRRRPPGPLGRSKGTFRYPWDRAGDIYLKCPPTHDWHIYIYISASRCAHSDSALRSGPGGWGYIYISVHVSQSPRQDPHRLLVNW